MSVWVHEEEYECGYTTTAIRRGGYKRKVYATQVSVQHKILNLVRLTLIKNIKKGKL